MKLLVYYNTRSGRYYLKFKAVIIDNDLSRITSQGHILVCVFDLKTKTRVSFNYRLANFLERLARFLKRDSSGLKRFIRFK